MNARTLDRNACGCIDICVTNRLGKINWLWIGPNCDAMLSHKYNT